MFDPVTEARLRRLHQPPPRNRRDLIVPVVLVVNLAMWAGVFLAAI